VNVCNEMFCTVRRKNVTVLLFNNFVKARYDCPQGTSTRITKSNSFYGRWCRTGPPGWELL